MTLRNIVTIIVTHHLILNLFLLTSLNFCIPISNGQEEKTDLYKVLEISEDASQSEIKKAYRRQALKWHPDRNPDNVELATTKFQEIGEAFEILSDEQKRKQYDKGGFDALKNNFQGNFHFHDPFSMFETFFDDDSFFKNFGHGKRGGGNKQKRGGFGDGFFGNNMFDFGDMMNGGGGESHSTFSFSSSSGNMGGGGFGGMFESMSESTTYINGKKIRKVSRSQNGKTIEETYENDKLIEKIIDGTKQDIKKLGGSGYKSDL